MKSSFRLILGLTLLVIFLSACGKVETGIQGKMLLGRCMGEQIAENCVKQTFYVGSLTIYDQDVKKVKTVKSKGDGTFIVALKPGNYFIHPENDGGFPMAADFKVMVKQGELTELTIYYDLGIR